MALWDEFDKDPGPWSTPKGKGCEKCAELQAQLDALNKDIEDMFLFAFASAFNSCGKQVIKAVSDKVTGSMSSGLFPDLAKQYMKEYFRKYNPPTGPEKDD